MADTSEKTIADELREAAARAREHLLSHVTAEVLPQTAIVTLCGNHEESEAICRNCVHFDARDRVLARLIATLLNAREALASWLEATAERIDNEARWHEAMLTCGDGTHRRSGFVHSGSVECGRWLAAGHDRIACGWSACHCFDHALAVARVLNRTAS
ncbi:hypothetical protein ACQP2T_63895 (plasmid) [Nonomuraea sp. CA-143628]|uniref:hypothetical protein n=1 Tax=Nonomuraea sp. CA-143628 TaxID=3239997 RepID=UPI003D90B8FB